MMRFGKAMPPTGWDVLKVAKCSPPAAYYSAQPWPVLKAMGRVRQGVWKIEVFAKEEQPGSMRQPVFVQRSASAERGNN